MSLAYIDATSGLEKHLEFCDNCPDQFNAHLGFINLCSPYKVLLKGYPLLSHYLQHPSCTLIIAAKQLELLRIVTRIAPVLGLVATMIPMGPALKALAAGNVQGISENLIVAFTVVIYRGHFWFNHCLADLLDQQREKTLLSHRISGY